MVQVRVAEADDAAAMAAIYAPIVETTAISFETVAPQAAEMRSRIEAVLRTHPWLSAMRDDEVVGFAYAGAHKARAAYRWSVDVTVYVADAARGAGVGTQLYQALFSILRLQGFRGSRGHRPSECGQCRPSQVVRFGAFGGLRRGRFQAGRMAPGRVVAPWAVRR